MKPSKRGLTEQLAMAQLRAREHAKDLRERDSIIADLKEHIYRLLNAGEKLVTSLNEYPDK
tara:strand:+ start:11164 stop:11346 length:183 start_codon:yes stop_codon:yes gene_type:complete